MIWLNFLFQSVNYELCIISMLILGNVFKTLLWNLYTTIVDKRQITSLGILIAFYILRIVIQILFALI